MALHVDILTIFPGMFAGVLGESIIARARQAGLVSVELTDIRDFATDRHRSVDDRPYGGGPGMVFRPEPVFAAVEATLRKEIASPDATRKVVLTPQGQPLRQRDLRRLAESGWIVLLCGHYEGFDERILQGLGFEEISIGDYVLSGGEIPAMAVLDGVTRLLPGALGHPLSASEESFERGVLDCPHYTRPPEFRGMSVPEVLVSGNHRRIEEWRREQSFRRTLERRRDLLEKEELGQEVASESRAGTDTGDGTPPTERRMLSRRSPSGGADRVRGLREE